MNKSLLFVLLFVSKVSVAQNSILAGKITDENNVPIEGALIQATHGKIVSDARADMDGLYYTQLLPEGYYRVDVNVDGKWYKGRKVYLEEPVHGRRYYDLHLVDGRLTITVDDGDPFLTTHIQKVRAEQKDIDVPLKAHFIIQRKATPGEHVPQEKK